jgi:CDP-6-deoxy-D-xylo-4-hexulose-3-dehydrase
LTTRQYRLADQTIDEQDLRDLTGWLHTNPWLSQQRLVAEFERRWAEWLGVRHAVFVNSGSSANLLMFWTVMISGRLRNRKVIVPAVCWPTTAAPAIQFGFDPVLCEAEPRTLGVDTDHLETLLRAHQPAAVAIVHVLGVPNEMAAIDRLKARFGFVLMEDACAAIGSQFDGRHAGTFGDLSTFSFFYGHQLSTIEGGMICTDDDQLHEILLQVRSHGWPKDLPAGREAELAAQHATPAFNRPFTFHHPGFNLRSTEVNARIGLSQLERLDAALARRVDNHRLYQSRFVDQPAFACQTNERATISSIAFGVLAQSADHRDQVAERLRAASIETRPIGAGNLSRQPMWAGRYGVVPLPVADRVYYTGFQLPNHPRLSADDVHFICDTVLGG